MEGPRDGASANYKTLNLFHQTRLLLPDPIDRVFHKSRTILEKHDAASGDELKVAEQ
jgi:hypothetical protein